MAPVRPVPVMVTTVPTGPVPGEKPAMVGAVTVKLELLSSVPPGEMTPILPVVAPTGTVAVICVALTSENVADVPLNVTPVTSLKPVPVIVTSVPTGPDVGVKFVMIGPVTV